MQQQENCSAWEPAALHDQAAPADGRLDTGDGWPTATAGRGAEHTEVAAGAAVGVGATGSPERSAEHAPAVAPVLGAPLCKLWHDCSKLLLRCGFLCMSDVAFGCGAGEVSPNKGQAAVHHVVRRPAGKSNRTAAAGALLAQISRGRTRI